MAEAFSTKSLVAYLLTTSSFLLLSTSLLRPPSNDHPSNLLSATPLVWPELKVSWRSSVATAVGFFGSAFGTVGGVGGGGIFVPMLNLIVGFDTKSAAAISKCMIMGASTSSVWYNLRVSHPLKGDNSPVIDYDLALLFQPMLMLGITIGVSLSVVFPYWLITILIIVLFMGTSSRSFFKATQMWKQETILKAIEEREREALDGNADEVVIDSLKPLLQKQEKTAFEKMCSNLRWKGILVLMLAWFAFLFLQIIKNGSTVCGPAFWIVNLLQFPVSITVFLFEARKLYKASRERRMSGNWEGVCEANIEWSIPHILFCALCGILGGMVGGLLGSGGGFILGPLLLEIGVIPQVASATATFVMMFSSSLSVVEFYFLKRFPIPYALYLMSVSVLAGFWGQYFVRKLVVILKRASIIVFILSSVIFASALTMGVIGTETSIRMIREHQYMGFLSFCQT